MTRNTGTPNILRLYFIGKASTNFEIKRGTQGFGFSLGREEHVRNIFRRDASCEIKFSVAVTKLHDLIDRNNKGLEFIENIIIVTRDNFPRIEINFYL